MVPQASRTRRRARPSEVYKRVEAAPPRSSRRAGLALIAVFLGAIGLPATGLILGLDSAMVLDEKRLPAPAPEVPRSLAALAEFPARFEAYFNDHFGFRARLIRWLALAEVRGLGVSSSPDVILGRDGWLFYGTPEAVKVFRGDDPFPPEQLEEWRALLEGRRAWLAERGIPYLVVIPPEKSSIYPEFLPAGYRRVNRQSRLGQFLDYMRAHSAVQIVDLREALWAAKGERLLYYPADTHWSSHGAYVGYVQILEALSARLPGLRLAPRREVLEVLTKEPIWASDLLCVLGLERPDREDRVLVPKPPSRSRPGRPIVEPPPGLPPTLVPQVWEQADATLPRAVVFRDSFASSLIPFLSDHFRRIVYSSEYTFNRAIVEFERPDVVIQEMVERALMGPVPDDVQ